jgi:hypothetical protein
LASAATTTTLVLPRRGFPITGFFLRRGYGFTLVFYPKTGLKKVLFQLVNDLATALIILRRASSSAAFPTPSWTIPAATITSGPFSPGTKSAALATLGTRFLLSAFRSGAASPIILGDFYIAETFDMPVIGGFHIRDMKKTIAAYPKVNKSGLDSGLDVNNSPFVYVANIRLLACSFYI